LNLSKRTGAASRVFHALLAQYRRLLPHQRCASFTSISDGQQYGIGPIFVINLARQPDRLKAVTRELARVLDASGKPLSARVVRFAAVDGQAESPEVMDDGEVEPFYTLEDQLFVEPQPLSMPDEFELTRPIRMSNAEAAVARSHIGVWKAIAQSSADYALVLEDDVWFNRSFGRTLDQAWGEMRSSAQREPVFDILYVSYREVRYGAPKQLISRSVFRPERGLWFLSGYVLSKRGAQRLLDLLPCYGPIDLWINHKFGQLAVRGLRQSVINQRLDTPSSNSYSILPALSKIGILDDSSAALFHQRPTHSPVFVFGPPASGLTSMVLALSMLGYRCCGDWDDIPESEFNGLMNDRSKCIFNAYVNIGSLRAHVRTLRKRYPHAKFIITDHAIVQKGYFEDELLELFQETDVLRLRGGRVNRWRELCEHLRLSPPAAPYPVVRDLGLRRRSNTFDAVPARPAKRLQQDSSPWVAEEPFGWSGISANVATPPKQSISQVIFKEDFSSDLLVRWQLRNDTFPGNLGLFRPGNVALQGSGGVSLRVCKEPLGVRNFSAAAISSRESFLYGRFEAILRATNVSGLVTGFFLHRDSPRQEIDVEIVGNRPDLLMVNVFYNPGSEGAKFDYGFRGTPAVIQLGFDASIALHSFAIEWDPSEIRWFVDGELVHRRAEWNPTPIPHLPMALHVNTWPTRSRELAGPLVVRSLPASANVWGIRVHALNATTGAGCFA
jgi:GR25 family glycosyltransferase involved in LPS biosynthesis